MPQASTPQAADRARRGLAADYAAATRSAGLIELAARTQVLLSGLDAAAFLNRFCTNKVDDLRPGEGREAFVTDAKGRALAWVLVLAGDDGVILDTDPGQGEALIAHLDFYKIRDRVELFDLSARRAELLVAGPEAPKLLGHLLASAPPTAPLEHVDLPLADCPVSLRRVDLSPRPAFFVSCAADGVRRVRRALEEAGVRCCGAGAWEVLRIEAGWPCSGRDVTRDDLPQEVGGDERAISWRKGCYLGQETVARLDARGHVNKILRGLRLAAPQPPAPGTSLSCDGQPAGRITSAAFSPGFRGAVALGYVRRGFASAGTRLQTPAGEAHVVALPMIDGGADALVPGHGLD